MQRSEDQVRALFRAPDALRRQELQLLQRLAGEPLLELAGIRGSAGLVGELVEWTAWHHRHEVELAPVIGVQPGGIEHPVALERRDRPPVLQAVLALDLMSLEHAAAAEDELRAKTERRLGLEDDRVRAAVEDLEGHAHSPCGLEVAAELRGLAAAAGSHRRAESRATGVRRGRGEPALRRSLL